MCLIAEDTRQLHFVGASRVSKYSPTETVQVPSLSLSLSLSPSPSLSTLTGWLQQQKERPHRGANRQVWPVTCCWEDGRHLYTRSSRG